MDLDVRTFVHRVGLGSDGDDPALDTAKRVFASLCRTLADLYGRERAIRADGSKTAEAHALAVTRLVDKHRDAPASALDSARRGLIAEIDSINGEIAKATRSAMDKEDAKELRAILREMSPAKRREYFAAARKAGNNAPLAAALAHPEPIASGMTAAERASLQRDYEAAVHGDAIARRAKLERAVEELDNGWTRYFNEANRLRDGRADDIAKAAEAADRALSEPVNLEGDEN